jgi:predicted acetyltransferase
MSETFRYAESEELPAIARMVARSFPQRSAAYWEEVLSDGWHGGREALWVAVDDGRPVAACQLLRLRQWWGGVAVPVTGVGAVSVALTHRRRGLAARLCVAGLVAGRDRGDLGSALFPFRTSFYRRLGYGLAGRALQYTIAPGVLPRSEERARVRLADDPAALASVRAVYAAWAAGQNGQLERTERSWRKVLDQEVIVAAYEGEAGPEGYLAVRYRSDLPVEQRYLEVEEAVWTTPFARLGLLGWLGSLGDQWRRVVYRAHPGEGFEEMIGDAHPEPSSGPTWALWYPEAVRLRGPMFRVLDLPGLLSSGRTFGEGDLDLSLEMEDPQLGDAACRVRFSGGRAELVEGDAASASARLHAPVDVLSRILAGDLRPSAAAAHGLARLEGADPRLLDRIFRLDPAPWTFDRF